MAWGLDDLLKMLDRWGEWKRMREAPARVDELQKRVEELEAKLGGKYPADVCRMCGARAARLYGSRIINHEGGVVAENWVCKECGAQDMRTVRPS
jgi:ribosomal protein L40E